MYFLIGGKLEGVGNGRICGVKQSVFPPTPIKTGGDPLKVTLKIRRLGGNSHSFLQMRERLKQSFRPLG